MNGWINGLTDKMDWCINGQMNICPFAVKGSDTDFSLIIEGNEDNIFKLCFKVQSNIWSKG